MRLKKIYDFLDSLAPFSNQEKYDNSGIIAGDFNSDIKKVLISLDATIDVAEEATEKNADLLITHHPVIFKPVYSIGSQTPLYSLIKSGVHVIAAHTNMDMAVMSDIMLERLGFPDNGEVLNVLLGDGKGFGKTVCLEKEMSAEELCLCVRDAFKTSVLRYTDSGKAIKKAALCSGSGGDELENAVKLGCQALITGDVKWSVFVEAQNIGFTLIDAGHFHTENILCKYLCEKLKAAFPALEVFIAEKSVDFCKYLH